MSIQKVRLGQLVLPITRWNSSRNLAQDFFRYIDLSCVDKDSKQITEATELKVNDAPSRAQQLVQTQDILVSTVRPNLNGVGYVTATFHNAIASTGFCVLRANPKVLDSRFLFHWLITNGFVRDMTEKATGANYPAVSDKVITDSLIPLPPLEEQQRIARVLDAADALRVKRKESLRLLEELQRSVFLEMFGDPVTNPKTLPTKNLSEVVNITTGKLDSNAATIDGEYPFFTCAKEIYKIDTFAFDCEAILLAGNNASADYDVKYYFGKFNAYQRTYIMTILQKQVSYSYLKMILEFNLINLKLSSKGSSTKYLTLSILNPIPVPIPNPILLQTFDRIYSKQESQKLHLEQSLSSLEALFASLQHQAFSGSLSASGLEAILPRLEGQ